MRSSAFRTGLATALLAALVTVLALTVLSDSFHTSPATLTSWYAAAWVLFAAAVLSLRKVSGRRAAVLVMAGGVAVAATGLLAPPRTSTDAYRYVWDGRVQAAGISPYDHAPADPALLPLRDGWLFPTGEACDGPDLARVPAVPGEVRCTRLNRPMAHTIYPPVAEGYFFLVHAVSPEGARVKPLQVGGALLSAGTTFVLLAVLRRRERGPHGAAYWAWCPAVPIEAVNNAHADVLGVLLAVAGLGAVAAAQRRSPAEGTPPQRALTGRAVLAGGLLGAATAVKMLPAVLLPGALSGVLARGASTPRARLRTAAAVLLPAAAVVAGTYLPYVLASRASVLGYLGGYAAEEGYEDASARNRFALLRLVLPDAWAQGAAAAVLLTVVLVVLRRGDPARPWRGALLVTGTAFLVLTPGYSWYALLVVALVALDGRWEWLGVAVAGAAAYVAGRLVAGDDAIGTCAYAVAAFAVLAGWAVRSGVTRPGALHSRLQPSRARRTVTRGRRAVTSERRAVTSEVTAPQPSSGSGV
ncbi:glycosyltransferase 87 family protein [Streptomyces sp. NPDC048639]|uniref:glycosyltransferase 87 family protein n=1 Tax=Streptomyces sp. NPDC048639 TaxID=3365581 RepID=UPI00371A445D